MATAHKKVEEKMYNMGTKYKKEKYMEKKIHQQAVCRKV
jgi:hypothetical protein